jgi:hypothetical protein
MKITRQMVKDQLVTEERLHHFFTEASDIQVDRTKGVPLSFETELGNGLRFVLLADSCADVWEYKQLYGCIYLTVFND